MSEIERCSLPDVARCRPVMAPHLAPRRCEPPSGAETLLPWASQGAPHSLSQRSTPDAHHPSWSRCCDKSRTLPLCATARLSLGGLARVQIMMFGARSKADWVVKHLAVDHDLVSELRFSGLDAVRRI